MISADHSTERILEAAGRIFAERGYRSATVRDICNAARANLAAVNYHFGGKERLYIEAVKTAYRSRMKDAPLPDWPKGTPASERLGDFILTMLTRMVGASDEDWQIRLMMRELFQPTAACVEWVHDFIRPHFEILSGILRELTPAGTPREKINLAVFSIIGQCLYYRVAGHIARQLVGATEYSRYNPRRLAEHITGFSVAALDVRHDAVARSRDRATTKGNGRRQTHVVARSPDRATHAARNGRRRT